MATDAPPAYNPDIDSAPPLYDEPAADGGAQPSAPVVAQPPPAGQMMAQPQQQVVYVDQFGNPIQQPQVQYVVVQNPNPAVAVQPVQTVQPVQGQTAQALELQVANNQIPVDAAPSQIPLGTTYAPKDDNHKWINDDDVVQNPNPTVQAIELQVNNNQQIPIDQSQQPSSIPLNTTSYVPKDDNHKWINDDELPPDYESIIAGEQPKEAPKKGMGCIDGCMATPHLKSW
eukprot:CAMPEP_0201596214 /NCGR_PEP_ID=MMETSP0190_2-20130828/192968_1 /ASSEMBLY_ACC=CAM_ASM_000263 /TAXON_ID=37353 /ORGANISM="Rosalina sp." /LENGTH=228 /DNA_ID=CAMNT_0048056483 /DNA_START=5 /DNA_END=688 /DNA_ORIENTATION=+